MKRLAWQVMWLWLVAVGTTPLGAQTRPRSEVPEPLTWKLEDLYPSDAEWEAATDVLRDVATDDLQVIEVKLQLRPGCRQAVDHFQGQRQPVEKVTRHVARVDRLDHHVDSVLTEPAAGPRDVACVRSECLRHPIGRGCPGHHMNAGGAHDPGVVQRLLDRSVELPFTARQGREPTLAAGKVADWRIHQHQPGPGILQRTTELAGIRGIRGLHFHRRKAVMRRRADTVQKRVFGVQQAEIGSEARHAAGQPSRDLKRSSSATTVARTAVSHTE